MMMTTWLTSEDGGASRTPAYKAGLSGKGFVASWPQPSSAKIRENCAIKNRFKLNLIHNFARRSSARSSRHVRYLPRRGGEPGDAGIRGRAGAQSISALAAIQKRLTCVS